MRWGTIIFLSSLLLACSSLSSLNKANFTIEAQKELSETQVNRETVMNRIIGSLQFRFYEKGTSFSGTGKLVKFDSKSRLEVSDPMGRIRFWLVGDEQGALAYYQPDQRAYSAGQGGAPYFKKFFGIALGWKEFQSLWLGVLPSKWRRDKQKRYEVLDSNKKIFIQISDQSSQVVGIKIEQEEGVWEMQFSDFDACCSAQGEELQLAHNVEIKLPGQDHKITIEWDEVNILESAPNPAGFLRKLPRNTKLLNLR